MQPHAEQGGTEPPPRPFPAHTLGSRRGVPPGTRCLLGFLEKEKPWNVFSSLLLTFSTAGAGAEGSRELPERFIRSSGT